MGDVGPGLTIAPASPAAHSAPPRPVARSLEDASVICFVFPRCRQALTVPDEPAGSKSTCRRCQQRLQVPAPPVNKTILAPFVAHQPESPPAAIPVSPADALAGPHPEAVRVVEVAGIATPPSRPHLPAAVGGRSAARAR
jgi:hypothetical protein